MVEKLDAKTGKEPTLDNRQKDQEGRVDSSYSGTIHCKRLVLMVEESGIANAVAVLLMKVHSSFGIEVR